MSASCICLRVASSSGRPRSTPCISAPMWRVSFSTVTVSPGMRASRVERVARSCRDLTRFRGASATLAPTKGRVSMRRPVLVLLALVLLVSLGCAAPMAGPRPFTVVETGIPELREALADGRITSRQLVTEYLTRIALYEDQLKAIITVNRPAPRHPHCDQGQHPYEGHADDGRRRRVRGLSAALRGHGHASAPRRRRHHHRQDRVDRARELGGGAAPDAALP